MQDPQAPIWQPKTGRVAASQLTAFTKAAEEQSGRAFADFSELHRWSITRADSFWRLVWSFTGVIGEPGETVVTDVEKLPGARWFPQASLNFARNLLRSNDSRPAIISLVETDDPEFAGNVLSFADLHQQTAALAAHLKDLGVVPGDRVAAWLPNVPETVITMLASSSLGAVFSACSPDFGASGALDRFGQVRPKVLIVCDGYSYNGKQHNITDQVRQVADNLEELQSVIWVERIGQAPEDASRFQEIVNRRCEPLQFHPSRFEDPLYILFSSGTTGKPKCIVHSAGGTLLQHLKEHRLHVDVRPEDRLFYYTTCGWMMWNWLISGLASGCPIVLYDGAPTWPTTDRLFSMADAVGVTIFGTSAKFLAALEKAGAQPRRTHDLGSIRTILSTGSPLSQEGFEYVYTHIKEDVQLSSISGGTDIVSCFVLGNPNAPVFAGEIQAPGLGMAVSVWNDEGQPVREQKGELVCTRSFPSCPIGFWNDPDGEKFQDAYFRRFPGVWTHGDFAEITRHDGFIIHGRSDAVLNPGGVRIGTAEIYRQVESFDAVAEAICVGQDWDDDVRVILFLVMQPGETLTAELESQIRKNIRANATPRHVPEKILTVPEIPRTISGKIVELAVRDVIHGREVRNTTALANPEALNHFKNRPELLE